jgi:BolA protein
MTDPSTGPVAREIAQRLEAALAPARLEVINDSEKHRGHGGYDGSGESHFTVVVEAEAFRGMNRVARQRAVNHALGNLLRERVHALAIKAHAPGE